MKRFGEMGTRCACCARTSCRQLARGAKNLRRVEHRCTIIYLGSVLFLILPSELIGLYFMHFVFLPLLAPFRFYALIAQFIRRDVLGRYRGSLLGLGWSFLTPLLIPLFSSVFLRRVGQGLSRGTEFFLQSGCFAAWWCLILWRKFWHEARRLSLNSQTSSRKLFFRWMPCRW